jgi:hypothetical protein
MQQLHRFSKCAVEACCSRDLSGCRPLAQHLDMPTSGTGKPRKNKLLTIV